MNFKHIWIVLKKEIKDIIRDRKTIITSIVVPMLIIPLMNILVGGGVEKLQKDINENVVIAVSEASNTKEIKDLLQNQIIKGNPNIKLIDVEDDINALRDDKVRLILEFEKGYKEKLNQGKTFEIKIMYDSSKNKSGGALGIVSGVINEYNKAVVTERLVASGINPEILEPTRIVENNVADQTKSASSTLSMLLPFLMVVLVSVGGIPAATDLVAGEKERNTFEPLLTTKPSRLSILTGKYLTVTLFSFVTVIATSLGIFIGYIIEPGSLTMGSGEQISGFQVQPLALILAVLITVALGMTFAGIQIALSTYAKSFKEAQTYLSFLMMGAMIPAYANMFTQPNEIPVYSFLVPVLNTISALKMVLGGAINYSYLIMALVSSIIYVVLTLVVAASLFNREKVLFRS